MSSRISSVMGGTKLALVAFKDNLTTNIYPVTELTGPKMKVAGATVKVYDDGMLQKGTIVITTDNINWLVGESEKFDVARYFGLSNTPMKKSTPSRVFYTPRRTSVPVGLNKFDSSPIASRRHSVIGYRPAQLNTRKSPLTFDTTKNSPKSRRRTTIGLRSSTPIVQKSMKQEKGKVAKSRKTESRPRIPTPINKKKDITCSSKLVQRRITDFYKVQEKQLLESSSLFPEQNISAFLASYDHLFQQPRSVALPLLQEELTTPKTASNTSFTTSLPPNPESCLNDSLTPMELFSNLFWDMDHCRLHDPWMITMDCLKDIKCKSKTPEVFAKNLMYRMFTIGELKDDMIKGCLNVTKIKIIKELTFDMFSGIEVSWLDCVLMIYDSVRYSILLSKTRVCNGQL